MPFKDNANNFAVPGGRTFQGERAMGLGRSLLDALSHVAPSLRGDDSPQYGAAEDAYVRPTEDAKEVAAFVAAAEAARDAIVEH